MTQVTLPAVKLPRVDWVLGLKIVLDALLGCAQATIGTVATLHTIPGGIHALATVAEFQWAFLITGLPTLLITLKARIATGLPNLPPADAPGTTANPTKTEIVNTPDNAVPTQEADTP